VAAIENISSVLIANRGEIALRIARACAELDIRVVALASEHDAGSAHGALVTETVHVAGSDAGNAYLDIDQITAAALATGVDAVHPGYGFLAENPDFADAISAAGIRFIGPPGDVMRALGDKRKARDLATSVGIPVLPGLRLGSADDAQERADEFGYPLIIKSAHGGGGRGLRVVNAPEEFEQGLEAARRESTRAFGRNEVFLERYVERRRHVEVQILADQHTNVLHLGTRDCSTQRRHQKIAEEAPAAGLQPDLEAALTDAARALARSAGYVGAGTVEFLVDADSGDYHLLEVNTRLQVEHTVTEMITGIDIVRTQIEIASGAPLAFNQDEIHFSGHAIQARINAEDPASGFTPSTGRVTELNLPLGPWIRCDTGLRGGEVIGPQFDSLLAKVIAWGPSRHDALARLSRALDETTISGIATTVPYLQQLLGHQLFSAGPVWTTFVEDVQIDVAPLSPSTDPAPTVERTIHIESSRGTITLKVPLGLQAAAIESDDTELSANSDSDSRLSGASAKVGAPMDGMISRYLVAIGDPVEADTVIAIVESMKMETEVVAGTSGTVRALHFSTGDSVQRGWALVEIAGHELAQ
jgi:acetyl-CoA/propionyl-CoA carboxylase biotin carboxyl carrier protein